MMRHRKWKVGTQQIAALQASPGKPADAPDGDSTMARHLQAVREALARNLEAQERAASSGRGLPALQDKMMALQQEERQLEEAIGSGQERIPSVFLDYLRETQRILKPDQKATIAEKMTARHGKDWDKDMPVPEEDEEHGQNVGG